MKTTRLAVLSVFSLLFSLPIQAAEYHVAPGIPGAADDNPGTLAKPWKTIVIAAATAGAGDTVLIHAGTYPEFVMIKNAGDADKPITFQAIADDEVILEAPDNEAAAAKEALEQELTRVPPISGSLRPMPRTSTPPPWTASPASCLSMARRCIPRLTRPGKCIRAPTSLACSPTRTRGCTNMTPRPSNCCSTWVATPQPGTSSACQSG